MTDAEIVNHYNLPSAFPEEWPAELDENDPSEDEDAQKSHPKDRRSRYFALERTSSYRGPYLGSQKRADGRDNAIPTDEPDPLGLGDSVIWVLKKRGLPVDDDCRLRNRFLLSSTSFSPALFLSQTHSSASIRSLVQGLEHLSQSIDQKSASLKVLVEANFERFVRAKATIDSVYTEMRNQGSEQDSSSIAAGAPSSGLKRPLSAAAANPERRKNALTRESEYGMKGIRAPLAEASVKAEELWGPALGGREREQMLKSVVDTLTRHRDIYELGGNLSKSIKARDYDSIFEHYTKARVLSNKAKSMAGLAVSDQRPLTEDETHTILATGKMWMDVDQQIKVFERDLWKRLSNSITSPPTSSAGYPAEEHMELISALLELGVEENPIWVWLRSRYDTLRAKITAFCERSKVEIEILRRRLATGEKPAPRTMASLLRQAPREGAPDLQGALDTDQVIELWECIHTYLNRLLSMHGGLLGEVTDLWEAAQSFIEGRQQKLLPVGFEGESRKHHRLSPDNVRELYSRHLSLIDLIREGIQSLFADPPIEDISLLASPIVPATPASPMGSGITPTESRFKLDTSNLPALPPKPGEFWEDYAFWPPYSNCVSGVHYLSKFLVIIGTAASEMAALEPTINGNSTQDLLKALVSVARERSVRITCAIWSKDAENCKFFEDWTRDSERRDLTKMPRLFVAFESAILGEMQKILYISEAMAKSDAVEVVTQPPAKLLQMVRAQFVSSVYKALSGLVENAENPTVSQEGDKWVLAGPCTAANAPDAAMSVLAANTVDAENRVSTLTPGYIYIDGLHANEKKNVRMLLTLSNLRALQADLVPQLVANFETSFSVTLTEEAKTLSDVLNQIDDRLFQSYTGPTISALNKTIYDGVTAADWVPMTDRPENVQPYVYNTLLLLVLVHTEISTTIPSASPGDSLRLSQSPTSSLLTIVLTHLLTQVFSSLLNAFRARPRYSLAALMQATLDTEFIGQTMSQYSSDEASALQSKIYVELDRRTTNEARTKLQVELGEMRGVLKKLREKTKGEFACFKKPKRATA